MPTRSRHGRLPVVRHARVNSLGRRAVVLSAAFVVSTTATTASAAGWWSVGPAQPLLAQSADGLGAGIGSSGAGLVSWTAGSPGLPTTVKVAPLDVNGVLGTPADASLGLDSRSLTVDAAGRGLLVGVVRPGFRGVVAQPVKASGRLGAPQTVSTRRALTSPTVAANRRGDAVIAWTEPLGAGLRLRVALRSRGGRFAAPQELGRDTEAAGLGPGPVAVAISERGEALVAYGGELDQLTGRASVGVWTGSPKRRFAGPLIAGLRRSDVEVDAAFDGKGRAFVAWATQRAGEGVHSGVKVLGASLAEGGKRFGRTQTVDPGGKRERNSGTPQLVGSPSGGATLMWTSSTKATAEVRVARAGASGRFGTARRIADSGPAGQLVVGPGGAVAATLGVPGGLAALMAPPRGVGSRAPEPVGISDAHHVEHVLLAAQRPTPMRVVAIQTLNDAPQLTVSTRTP